MTTTVDNSASRRVLGSVPGRCSCSSCAGSRARQAIRDAVVTLDQAADAQCERSEELGMSHAYLVDEIKTIIKSPLSLPVRGRLRKALKVAAS